MTPLLTAGTGSVRITNQESTAIAGTLVLVASEELSVTPAERAITVQAQSTLEFPLELRNRTALPGSSVALWAYVTLPRSSYVDTVTTSATIPIAPPLSEEPLEPLAWIVVALATLGALVWMGRRWMQPANEPRTRAERRRP